MKHEHSLLANDVPHHLVITNTVDLAVGKKENGSSETSVTSPTSSFSGWGINGVSTF